jgi:hypothetical protein
MKSSNISGLDKLQRQLDDLQRKVEKASGTHHVLIDELLTPDFMMRFTNFVSAEVMFESSGFKIDSLEDLESIPGAEWDAFIATNTQFATWEELMGMAGTEYIQRRLE